MKTHIRRERGSGSWRKRGKSILLTYSITGPGGERQQMFETLTGPDATEKKAKDRLAAIRTGVVNGEVMAPTGETLGGWAEYWIENVLEAKEQTRHWYARMLRQYVPEKLLSKRLSDFKTADVQAVLTKARKDGYAVATRRRVHAVLSGLFKGSVTAKKIAPGLNPMLGIKAPKLEHKRVEAPTLDDVMKVMRDVQHLPYSVAYHVLLAIGARRAEVAALTWEDVDLDARTIHISKSITRIKGKGLIVDTPKTMAGVRTVHIDRVTANALRTHRAEQAARVLASGGAVVDSGYAFTLENGTVIDPQNLTQGWRKAAKRVGVKARLHDLRHVHATYLLGKGLASVKEVQVRLGHSSAATTLSVYSHILPGRDEQVADAFGAIMGGAG
ncbi:MAG: site-specific integrase [Chloroflexi bacterium]|nr:site-specific integrase [Chloroflexota bacterium]